MSPLFPHVSNTPGFELPHVDTSSRQVAYLSIQMLFMHKLANLLMYA